jgi:hypothetical protein
MRAFKWFLQRFADGGDGGTSAGEGAADSGVTTAAAGQEQQQGETLADRLRQMGVPEEKLQRRAYQRKIGKGETSPKAESAQAAAAGQAEQNPQNAQEQQTQEQTRTYTDDEVQRIVQRRLAKFKPQSDAMEALNPALEMLVKHYGLDVNAPDYAALSQAILEDDAYYEQRAIDMGVPVDVAKRLEAAERLEEARRRDAEMNEQDRQIREFRIGLEQQSEAMKQKYPGFDLNREMQNDTFVRMVSPGVGLTVEQAFTAVHYNELMEATRRMTQQNLSNTIRSNQTRPNEGGSKRSDTVPAHNLDSIRHMPRERRQELIERMRRGERVTPDMMY